MDTKTRLALAGALVVGGLGLYLAYSAGHDRGMEQGVLSGEGLQMIIRERDKARARVETLTASVAEIRGRLAEAERRETDVQVRVVERRVVVRERAQRELSAPPSQAGAQESLRRLDAFRQRLDEKTPQAR
jgi:hypothetical protein